MIQREKVGINTHIWPWSRSDEEAPYSWTATSFPRWTGRATTTTANSIWMNRPWLASSPFIHHTRGFWRNRKPKFSINPWP